MIIDTHTHWPVGRTRDPAHMLAALDLYGTDRAVVSGSEILRKVGNASEWNDRLVEFCRRSEGRLIPMPTVHLAEQQAALDEAKRCLDIPRVVGLKHHPWLQGETLFCETMDRLCAILAERNAPIMFHDGTPPYAMSSQVGVLARLFPDTTFVLGHGGILHFWQEAAEIARQHPNVYITFCGNHPRAMQTICRTVDPERIIWGTDYSGPDTEDYIAYRRGLFDGLDITDVLRRRILHTNPAALYGLDG